MTRYTQTNPIIKISKILLRPVRPMHIVTSSFFATYFANVRSSLPSSDPRMQGSVADLVSFPNFELFARSPDGMSCSFSSSTVSNTQTFSGAEPFTSLGNPDKITLTNFTNKDRPYTLGKPTTFSRTENSPIWSRFELGSALFAYFKHVLIVP